jgi:two-component system, NtrC family, sensor kinase
MGRFESSKYKYRSVRSILVIWFLFFSVIPLLFMGWYFLFKFETALENEVVQRLKNNGREIETIISDYYSDLYDTRDDLLLKPDVMTYFTTQNVESFKPYSNSWLQKSVSMAVSFYTKEGQLILSAFKDEKKSIRYFSLNNEKVQLNDRYLKYLSDKNDIAFVDPNKTKLTLILFSKVLSKPSPTQATPQLVGYIEQTIDLSEEFLQRIKSKLKIESVLLSEASGTVAGGMVAASKPYFKKIPITTAATSEQLINFEYQEQRYGFILYPVSWGRSKFYVGLGDVRQDSQALLNNIRFAFISVISVVAGLLFITILLTTNWFLKPVNKLINGLRAFDSSEQILQIPVTNQTEVGLLTQAFNEMSYKIYRTRADLKKKIKELEVANTELKEAQTKLVHSAKMTSLGQLVAGVAHELNNPIGFIFSNTAHLKEYSDKLFELIDLVEKYPEQMQEKKVEIEYDYIKNDLPRLIKSCQDGAQRTRDIVLGLRNFSRLEEAQLKEIDIKESLTTTLELLSGEIKNRIQIHTQFDPLPKVLCFASQINQVFMNILSNAVQAVQGQGEIWITAIPLKVGNGQVGKIQISIQDSGIGMDPQTLEKIFEPFFTTKGVGQGTGLGLSISYGIIQNHGGEIHARSQKNVGTEFTVILPVKPLQEKNNRT